MVSSYLFSDGSWRERHRDRERVGRVGEGGIRRAAMGHIHTHTEGIACNVCFSLSFSLLVFHLSFALHASVAVIQCQILAGPEMPDVIM